MMNREAKVSDKKEANFDEKLQNSEERLDRAIERERKIARRVVSLSLVALIVFTVVGVIFKYS